METKYVEYQNGVQAGYKGYVEDKQGNLVGFVQA